MNRRNWLLGLGVAAALLVIDRPESSWGQVFLQSLPADGSQVVFAGVLRVTEPSPTSSDETVTTDWLQQITISSVGSQSVDGRACRWIELKVERGKRNEEGNVDLGQAGVIIYKCLVPEDAVGHETSDFLPIVRGWRKIADGEPQPMKGQLLRIAPIITLIDAYPDAQEKPSETLQIQGLGDVACTVRAGSRQYQGRTGRAANNGQIWLSDRVSFGIIKWQATARREQLLGSEENGQYRFAGELFTEMTIIADHPNAQSELPELH